MSEHLCNLSTGDKVYFYDKSIVIYFQGARKILSTSLYNGCLLYTSPSPRD